MIKGYKVFDNDFSCRGYQYEIGKTYKHKGDIKLYGLGFHFCNKLSDCFNYYSFDPNNKVAEIEAVGLVKEGDDNSVTDEIRIVKEITWFEALEMVNSGKCNTGLLNAGNSNTGNWNAGNMNAGNMNTGNMNTGNSNTGRKNTGNWNTGNSNTGHWNAGDCNTGNSNAGHWNAGHWNAGSENSGMFNSCDHSNGLFNSQSPKIYMFNKPTNLTYEEFKKEYSEVYNLLIYSSFYLTEWIFPSQMTGEEKETYPDYQTTNGCLRVSDYKTTCQEMWNRFSDRQKKAIQKLPNFDKVVFKDITGIEV